MRRSICHAIEEHRLLQLDYAGRTRVVEPHIYGEDSRGHELLSAYQLSGGSVSGERTGWKLFDLEKVGSLEIMPVQFHGPQPAYNPGDATFRRVYSRL